MKIRRVFVCGQELTREGVLFSPSNSNYLRNVLRLREGDLVEAFDGACRYSVRLKACSSAQVSGDVMEVLPAASCADQEIALAISCVRPGPFEEILRHGTELGVCRFVPIHSSRSTRRPSDKKGRWDFIVRSAVAQSEAGKLPDVEAPTSLQEFLARELSGYSRIILSRCSEARPLLAVLHESAACNALILVGPEGGFAPSEEAEAIAAGYKPVSLGPFVLRTETAALAAVAVVRMWGQWLSRDPCKRLPDSAAEPDLSD